MKKIVITGVLLFAALLFAGAQQGYAYDNVTSSPDGGCLQCHPTTAGTGLHTISGHTTCSNCHPGGVTGKNVKSAKCIVCHPQGNVGQCNLVNLTAHPKSGVQACLTCHPSCAPTTTTIPAGTPASCADWVGDWSFTYDNATTTNICFDNESLLDGTFNLCDNASKDNCTCFDNVTSKQLCVDNTTFTQCANNTIAGCYCVDNPFYKTPGGPNGVKAVTITQAVTNLTLYGHVVPCTASGTRGTTPVTIVQVDNATAIKLDIAKLSYIVFEGASFDNVTFAQVLPSKFLKHTDNTTFSAETLLNTLGLVSGIKNTVIPPAECTLKVIPKTIFKLLAFVNPFSPFVIIAPSDVAFERPISIDWGGAALNDIIHIKLGKRLIFGFGFARPLQLEKGDFTFTVTYGDDGTACGPISVK